jgi:hypothetical protein
MTKYNIAAISLNNWYRGPVSTRTRDDVVNDFFITNDTSKALQLQAPVYSIANETKQQQVQCIATTTCRNNQTGELASFSQSTNLGFRPLQQAQHRLKSDAGAPSFWNRTSGTASWNRRRGATCWNRSPGMASIAIEAQGAPPAEIGGGVPPIEIMNGWQC